MGLTAVIELSESTKKTVAGTVPNLTLVAPLNSLPDMTTEVPPVEGPTAGLTFVITGMAESISAEKKHSKNKRVKKFLRLIKFPPKW